jgi:hypothetical protein
MPKLVACRGFRLYRVSENMDENGLFQLVPFDDDYYNEIIKADEIEGFFCELIGDLYGNEVGKTCYEIHGGMSDGVTISIKCDNDKRLEIPDISARINVIPERSCIIVNSTHTEYQWIIAVKQGTIYEEIGLKLSDDPF